MLAHDAARSGATRAEIRPPFARKWYRLFPKEGLMAGVQPVVSGGRVLVGTLAGRLYAIDSESGADIWRFEAGGPILHACAADPGKVFFGAADGRIYAVRLADGALAWSVQTGAAVWNAPLVCQGLVVAGSRDGRLYAIDAVSGRVRWTGVTGGPLVGSPAADVKRGRMYAGSEDMHVYAFDLKQGELAWKSPKLPGVSFRGYHPVVAPDGSVLVTVTPAVSQDAISPILMDMVKEIFGDLASWRHTKEENDRLREANFKLLEKPETYPAQLAYLRRRLAEEPTFQTFFVLDPATGKQKFVAPIVYAESMNGPAAPAIVAPDGKAIVKYQVLLRSRYGHYSPFLNVGYLDTATGQIAPIMDQSRTYGWHDSLLLVHDEQSQLVVSGRVLINTHQDNVNAMDLDTLQGYGEPFCRNIHEPEPGEALGIWALLLRRQELPVGKEWLARGTAVYGGGSAIDVPVSVAGDSFYFLPTHELNAGAAVIAYRMRPDAKAEKSPAPKAGLTEEDVKHIERLRWDWDTLEMPRLKATLEGLPRPIPGTRQAPLTEQAEKTVEAIPDAELDRFLWEVPEPRGADRQAAGPLATELRRAVRELISQDWQPLVFPEGKHPSEGYRFFLEPTETLLTLARAYPYLDEELRAAVRGYVGKLRSPGGPLESPTGLRVWRPDSGGVRSAYDVPPERLLRTQDDLVRSGLARLDPLWRWAQASGDWGKLTRDWETLRGLIDEPPGKFEEDCHNGRLAGMIAYCRLAKKMNDGEAVGRGVAAARQAIRQRLRYELAHPRGGLITLAPVNRAIFARWRHLSPEVGRLLAAYGRPIHEELMSTCVDFHRPTWWMAWNVELMWRNETSFSLPTMSAEVFAAKALILGEPAEKLQRYVDLPWCKADLFYIQKLVLCLEAAKKG